jgi:hypothetical protein
MKKGEEEEVKISMKHEGDKVGLRGGEGRAGEARVKEMTTPLRI